MKSSTVFFILRIVAALILLQTLFFKFTAAEESVAVFAQLSTAVTGDASLQPAMRIGSGVVLLASLAILGRYRGSLPFLGKFT
jgi:hypothetical protein